MPTPALRPCPWPADFSCCKGIEPPDGQTLEDFLEAELAIASELLWAFSGRRFGICTTTLRPCRRRCESLSGPWSWGWGSSPVPLEPVGLGGGLGGWWWPTCGCQDDCSCTALDRLRLPRPTVEVDEVKVDGVVLGPHLYRVDGFRWLTRLKGGTVAVGLPDWSSATASPPAFPGGQGSVSQGDIQFAGPDVIMSSDPLFLRQMPYAAGPGFDLSMGNQSVTEPIDLVLGLYFTATGDTATLDPEGVDHITGPAAYNPATGLLTYTGAPPVEAAPAAQAAQVVHVHYRRGFSFHPVQLGQGTFIWSAQWTDQDMPGTWPSCQDLSLPDTEPGTWSATVKWGKPVPLAGQRAVAEYACQLWKSCNDPKNCELPQRIQSISRQGMSVTFIDPMKYLDKGRTGLYSVDIWIAAVNPFGQKRKPGVYRADARPNARRIG